MTLTELGQGIGWAGGCLFLLRNLEQQIRTWRSRRALKRFHDEAHQRGHHLALTADRTAPPRFHAVQCLACGERVAVGFACKGDDAIVPSGPPYVGGIPHIATCNLSRVRGSAAATARAVNLCHYCAREAKSVQAVDVAHDARGCVHVCHRHSRWRETTSSMGGHKDCPSGHPDGRGPLVPHKASR